MNLIDLGYRIAVFADMFFLRNQVLPGFDKINKMSVWLFGITNNHWIFMKEGFELFQLIEIFWTKACNPDNDIVAGINSSKDTDLMTWYAFDRVMFVRFSSFLGDSGYFIFLCSFKVYLVIGTVKLDFFFKDLNGLMISRF